MRRMGGDDGFGGQRGVVGDYLEGGVSGAGGGDAGLAGWTGMRKLSEYSSLEGE